MIFTGAGLRKRAWRIAEPFGWQRLAKIIDLHLLRETTLEPRLSAVAD
jgi:hypothetical protein